MYPGLKINLTEKGITFMKRVFLKPIAFILLIAAIAALSGCGAANQTANEQTAEPAATTEEAAATETVYNVYFGLNDADTGEQIVSMDEASAYIRSVIESYGYGYTEHRTYGAYTENGVSKGNDNLLYMLVFVDEEDVRRISEEVAEHLNLASVLCLKGGMEYEFFMGAKKQETAE